MQMPHALCASEPGQVVIAFESAQLSSTTVTTQGLSADIVNLKESKEKEKQGEGVRSIRTS